VENKSLERLDKAVKTNKLIIGLKSVLKALQAGGIKEVIVASNGKNFIPSIKRVSGKTLVTLVEENSKELGIKCKRPFNGTVIGLIGTDGDLKK